MAVMPTSSSSGPASGVWVQIQQQQAQRTADQAQQQARSLQDKARTAQSVADRAQENARSLGVQSAQAQGVADAAQLGLSERKSGGEVQTQLTDLQKQLGVISVRDKVVTAPTSSSTTVINSFGQQTGGLLNVTA